MRHVFVVVMLSVGMFAGIFAGIHELRSEARQAKALGWKQEVADICVQAARRTLKTEGHLDPSALDGEQALE
jgi:hypothetical protein